MDSCVSFLTPLAFLFKPSIPFSLQMADLSLSLGRAGLKQTAILPLLDTLAEMYHASQALPSIPQLAETSHMDLRTLLEVLFVAGGIAAVKEFFSSHAYRVSQPCKGSPFEDSVVGIKYIDGLNNLWRPVWAREARGRFYYYDAVSKKVHALKDTLQRGVEVLTQAHAKAAIAETQDMKLGEYAHLDDIQQACIQKFLSPENVPMNAHLSGKVDGSLLIVSVYPRDTAECHIMEEILEACGDSFSRQLAKSCTEANAPLVVVATQGTLMIGSDMQDYFVTALQALTGQSLADITTVKRAWSQQIPHFLQSIQEYIVLAGLQHKRVHLCFEAFCKNRRTFLGRLHTELAISYDRHGFNLLGALVDNTYIPHFALPAAIFAQPISLPIRGTQQVFTILEDMDRVVLGTLENTAFLEKYGFPADSLIHMEGWVLLTPLADCYDYAKIKTSLYYKCHKIRSQNVPALLALPTSCDATYPILAVLREFHANANQRFTDTIAATIAMLEAEVALGEGSAFYAALPAKARVHFNPEKKDTLFRMLINVCGDLFKARLQDILCRIWNLEEPHEDMFHLVKQILTKHTPWQKPLATQVVREAMRELYSIMVESMNPA